MTQYDPVYLAAIEAEQQRLIAEYVAAYVEPEPVTAPKFKPWPTPFIAELRQIVDERDYRTWRPRYQLHGLRKGTLAETRERARLEFR